MNSSRKDKRPSQIGEASLNEALARRVQDGDREAESEIYARYRRGLIYLLRRLTNDIALAEDLAQEAFIILIEKLRAGSLAQPAKLTSYLRGIARKLAVRHLARQRRRETPASVEFLGRLVDPASDQFAEISREETRRLVLELVDELRMERDRQILLRYWVYDQDKITICAALQIDESHFHRVIHRAKVRFRNLLLKSDKRGRLSLVK